jgi:hypothetical protein
LLSCELLLDQPRVRLGVGVAMTGPVRGAALVAAARAGAVVAGACMGVGGGAALVGAGFSAWVSTARVGAGARVAVGGGSVGVAGRCVGAARAGAPTPALEPATLREVDGARAGAGAGAFERAAAVVGRAGGTVGLVATVATGSGLPRMTASSVASGVGWGGGIRPASATRLVPPQAVSRPASASSGRSTHHEGVPRLPYACRQRRVGRGAGTGIGSATRRFVRGAAARRRVPGS